jgi:hypothetical protein
MSDPMPTGDTSLEAVLPDSCPLANLPDLAQKVKVGIFSPDLSPDQRFLLLDAWLRWAQSDGAKARMRWQYLASQQFQDRDGYVLDLWRSIVDVDGKNHDLLRLLEERLGSWDYYGRHFFGWFLSRFDLGAACRVFPVARLARALPWCLAGLALVAEASCFHFYGFNYTASLCAVLLLLATLPLLGWVSGLPSHAFVQSLIPRLAATVGFGYVFFVSTPQSVWALRHSSWVEAHWPWALLLLLGGAQLFIVLHIYRRVYPAPRLPVLFGRALNLLVLAIGYSSAGLLLAAPVLFSPSFLYSSGTGEFPHPGAAFHHLALLAAIALNLGVILQLAWDEKPLTEPL